MMDNQRGGKRDDGILVRRARGGDRDAFTALVDRYRDMVYAAAFYFLGSAEDAQDAAQEAFIAAYCHLGQLREPEKFAPWLRRLTLENYAKAQEIAQERGDAWSQARCLTSPGLGRLWGDTMQARAVFAQALPLYEASGDLGGATYCRAVQALADRLGPEKLRVGYSPEQGFNQPILGFFAGCDTFRSEAGSMFHLDESCYIGYTWPDGMGRSPLRISRVFWLSSHLKKILDANVPVGGGWSGNTFSNTAQPLKATVTVLSDAETVTVPAGTFAGSLLTEQMTTEDGPPSEANRELCGTVRAWYARNVGLVQFHARHEDGLEATLRLEEYDAGAESGEWLPLAVGSRWEYGWADVPAEYAAREAYRVAAQKDRRWYIEHWAYAF